jgi:hypothetical protein
MRLVKISNVLAAITGRVNTCIKARDLNWK